MGETTTLSQSIQNARRDIITQAMTESRQSTAEQVSTAVESVTGIIQENHNIVLSAMQNYVETSSFETYQSQIQTQFQQSADSIQILVSDIKNQIADIDGDLQAKYSQVATYFRFNTDGLHIGMEGNDLELLLSNDKLSFIQSGYEVAYMSDRVLYITDGHFLNKLRIGNFAFVPRSNGNMSLKEVD